MPKLDLDKLSYLTTKEEQQFRDDLAVSDDSISAVLRALKIADVPVPRREKPPTEIDPDTLDDLTDRELGAMYMEYNGWAQYIRATAAKAHAQYRAARNIQKRVTIKLKGLLAAQGIPKAEIARELQEIPFYEEVAIEVDRRQLIAELTEAYRGVYSNNADALSRIITLRGQEMESDRKSRGVNSLARGPNMGSLRQRHAKIRNIE